jgi:hypothetical protein
MLLVIVIPFVDVHLDRQIGAAQFTEPAADAGLGAGTNCLFPGVELQQLFGQKLTQMPQPLHQSLLITSPLSLFFAIKPTSSPRLLKKSWRLSGRFSCMSLAACHTTPGGVAGKKQKAYPAE